MKRLLFIILFLAVTLRVAAQDVSSEDLMGLGLPPSLAEKLGRVADTDRKLSSDTSVIIESDSDGTPKTLEFDASGNLTASSGSFFFGKTTADASDDEFLSISGGGATGTGRGAELFLYGNEDSPAGTARVRAGAVANGDIELTTNDSTGTILLQAGAASTDVTIADNLVTVATGTKVVEATETLAATGSVQGDAALITEQTVFVTGSDATKGVILPATPDVGVRYTIINTPGAVLKLYPGSGDAIDNLGTNAAASLAANSVTDCYAISTSAWYCGEKAGA